jgi:hypothetical protein
VLASLGPDFDPAGPITNTPERDIYVLGGSAPCGARPLNPETGFVDGKYWPALTMVSLH